MVDDKQKFNATEKEDAREIPSSINKSKDLYSTIALRDIKTKENRRTEVNKVTAKFEFLPGQPSIINF